MGCPAGTSGSWAHRTFGISSIFFDHPWNLEILLGAVALAIPRFPRLKEWAYAGVLFDLTGAVASLFASGLMEAGTIAYPIAMTGVAAASWALRPRSRCLGPS
jgi:hypothetical protein